MLRIADYFLKVAGIKPLAILRKTFFVNFMEIY